MNYVEYKIVDVGGPEADLGSRGGALDLGKCMKDERGSNSEEYLKKYFTGRSA